MGDRKQRRILPHATPNGDDAVDNEVRHHVQERIDRLVAAGWSRDEAEAEAWRRFGDPEAVKREMVSQAGGAERRTGSASGVRQILAEAGRDVRQAGRALLRRPVFTGAAVLTLAIAIAANATIFSVVDATLLRPLPYPHADRLMRAFLRVPDLRTAEGMRNISWSYPKYELFRERQNVFEALSLFRSGWFTITGEGGAEHLDGEFVSDGYLPMLGVEPVVGRNFLPEENAVPGTHYVALLGYDLWSRRFGRDPGVLGTEIRLLDPILGDAPESYRVVGVLPRGFRGLAGGAEVWVPIMTLPAAELGSHASHNKHVLGRLRAGVDAEEAKAAMAELGREIHEVYPARGARADEWTAGAVLLNEERVDPTIRRAVLLTFGAVGCLLLIACVNVANLLLARASTQRREVAIRKAMGAGRGRIVRYLLVESGLLALMGSAMGLAAAYWGVVGVRGLAPVAVGMQTEGFFRGAMAGLTVQGLSSIRFDAAVALFGIGVAILSVFIFGLAPALHSARGDLTTALRSGSRDDATFRVSSGILSQNALVVVEVAFTFALLVASALMLRSVGQLLAHDKGFEPEGVLSAELYLPRVRYGEAGQASTFFSALQERLDALPGVDAAAVSRCFPLEPGFGRCNVAATGGTTVTIVGDGAPEDREFTLGVNVSTPAYFAALGIPLVQGRNFGGGDRGGPPVALVTETAARRYWPPGSPVGTRVALGADTVEVVGMVGDAHYEGLAKEPEPLLYVVGERWSGRNAYVALRARGDPSSLASALRRTVAELDPDLPLMNVRPLTKRVHDVSSTTRFASSFLTVFAVVGLLLAAVGIYGVVAFGVARRRHEIGVRVAIGAERTDVVGMVLGQGARMAAFGVGAGLVLVFVGRRLLGSVLYGVEPFDPVTLIGTAILLTLVALLASSIPARRAAGVDPVRALRAD